MSLVALFNLGGAEIILILALILILVGARKLPELAKGLEDGTEGFRLPNHPVLVGLTFILGAVCFVLVVYELSK